MYNDYDGIQHDYTKKQGLVWQQVFLPSMAPPEWQDREKLWNAVEENEKTKDSRLAREFIAALPRELDRQAHGNANAARKTQESSAMNAARRSPPKPAGIARSAVL